MSENYSPTVIITRTLSAIILLVLIVWIPTPVTAAQESFAYWFRCGITFWGSFRPANRLARGVAQPPSPSLLQEAEQTDLTTEELRRWGTPVVGPAGSVSYQLPPRPVLDLFRFPNDDGARAYLAWNSDKARRREEAFDAIRRVAAELGYTQWETALQDPTTGVSSALALAAQERATRAGELAEALPSELSSQQTSPDDGIGAAPPPIPTRVRKLTPLVSTPSSATAPAPLSTPATRGPTDGGLIPGKHTHIFYFFSPKCPYCAQETPLLNELLRGRTDVVGIAMDSSRDELLAYVHKMRITFPVTLDRGESQQFGVTGYPTLISVGGDGQAVRLNGLASRDELARILGGGQ